MQECMHTVTDKENHLKATYYNKHLQQNEAFSTTRELLNVTVWTTNQVYRKNISDSTLDISHFCVATGETTLDST